MGWCSALAFSVDSSRDGGGGGCGDPTRTSPSKGASKAGSRFIAKLSRSEELELGIDGEASTLDNGPGPLSVEDDEELETSVTIVVVLSY